MLSVCIPVFNFTVHELVRELAQQADTLNIEYEIFVVDDASLPSFKIVNQSITHYKNVRYIELSENLGRSKVRNFLARNALYKNLLFLDCDAKIVHSTFLKNYCNQIPLSGVVVGGIEYSEIKPEKELVLRWNYGRHRETSSADYRQKEPYSSFKTFCFLIPKKIFDNVHFDETIIGYGHEDTWFGIELKRKGIAIIHIDNPLMHLGLEEFTVFLRKTEEGISNLKALYLDRKTDLDFINMIKLLSVYHHMNALSRFCIRFSFKILKPFLLVLLKSGNPKMLFLDFYKLGYLCSIN
jgi:GT2 family glycosyltransferase